ncbi:MAG: 16S rRNA (guanine(966)-N(2))-methyltransferase RsmD [Nesterenkonia sp.]|uniref:16S rRNA (guanine(966)-N(2))-methyltransferase RsmD n=1 Tax=Nesterenkonia marinintestina TaxID=2979865 RepID=UPI0021C23ECC|nr:16S rRNA (guanine(966)-N(2))-methyltransferase RsmD [Nesterenkonia sp. GX14115]MDO5492337.1 16S rRNA (guanine(966)-N(2))-methyltransferase RsmD [Nesterenkonia sp.]
MARIISGTHRGRRLASVPGDGTRPTSDRVKESLFSRLEGYDALVDAVVVDAYAGSGALGFESLSRGARSLEAVDLAEGAVRVLRRSAGLFEPGSVSVHKGRALTYLRQRDGEPIELLFLDPPYGVAERELAEVLAAAAPQLHRAATIVVERDAAAPEPTWPSGVSRFHEKTYGSTRIWMAEPE